jgi:VanZ family protein
VQTKSFQNIVQRWAPALIVMVIIFVASSIPSKEMPGFGGIDMLVKKGGHMLGYALLALALIRGMGGDKKYLAPMVIGCVLVYAASDEFHQLFVAGRSSEFSDVLVDTLGGLIGYLCWKTFASVRKITRLYS